MTDPIHELERDPEDALDRMIRPELCWKAPAHLSANLMSLVAMLPSERTLAAHEPPKRWYVVLVTILTLAAVLVSLLVAWDIYGVVSVELGLPSLWQTLNDTVSGSITSLFGQPQVNLLVTLLGSVRNYLYWLLLVAVLWAALDGWTPSLPFRRQQVS